MSKYIDTTWDFIGSNTKTYTHCYHTYPAMMIPPIASRIIEKYGQHAQTLFDPYCGTGTSLLEANLKGIHAIGTDLNPLARLIAATKTTKINLQLLDLYLKDFNDYCFSLLFDIGNKSVVIPNIKNIDYWFDKKIQEKLAFIKAFIHNIEDVKIANFFKIAFSETVRESSWTRNSEFKMFRMNEEQLKKFNPDVFGLIQSKLARNRKGLKNLLEVPIATTKVYDFDTVHEIKALAKNSIDIVVTSPPYGDSRTTVAYGQFSRLANEWLGIENATQIDSQLMGGKKPKHIYHFDMPILDDSLSMIAAKDVNRAKEVSSFYSDYQQSIKNVSASIHAQGYACYVVGNRKVKGVTLPTDEITKQFFENEGFTHQETIIRNIPNKRMPSKNSPSNVVGDLDSTMTNEYIVIMQKK